MWSREIIAQPHVHISSSYWSRLLFNMQSFPFWISSDSGCRRLRVNDGLLHGTRAKRSNLIRISVLRWLKLSMVSERVCLTVVNRTAVASSRTLAPSSASLVGKMHFKSFKFNEIRQKAYTTLSTSPKRGMKNFPWDAKENVKSSTIRGSVDNAMPWDGINSAWPWNAR